MTNETQFKLMAKDLIAELWRIWGREKFNQWWTNNIVSMNGRVYWNYHSLYLVLKDEHDRLEDMYQKFFGELEEETAIEYRQRVHDETPR